jgi:phosphoglycolate phosphatase-like HAD superfamily hydrolase
MGAYVDNILADTLRRLGAHYLPKKDEKYRLWASEEDFFNVLEEWGVQNPQNFWKVFDEIDFKFRKELINKNQVFLYDDVYSTLKNIYNQNKKMAMVSNAAYYIVNYILERFKITEYFLETFCLGYYDNDQELAKPSPKGILTVLDKLKFNPKNSKAVYIGDSRLDIIAAKKANINSCLIRREITSRNRDYNKWEIQPDFIIEGLNEIFLF